MINAVLKFYAVPKVKVTNLEFLCVTMTQIKVTF